MNYLQTFFTNKWYKGHHNITPNSGRAKIYTYLTWVIHTTKSLYLRVYSTFFINRKPEKYNTITPNSGRPDYLLTKDCWEQFGNIYKIEKS